MPLRPEIALSWERAASTGLDPGSVPDPDDVFALDPSSRLHRAAQPVLDVATGHLAESSYSLILADREARIVDLRVGDPALRPRLESVGAVVGARFTESVSGTNSIATTTEIRRDVAVHGEEHYLESFKRFACHGVPIRDPLTRRHAGVLDITCLAEHASPLLRPFLRQIAGDIETSMLDAARRSHRTVLAAFESARAPAGGALVAFGADLVLTDEAATDLLSPTDHTALQTMARGGRSGTRTDLDLASGERVTVALEPIDGGGALARLTPHVRPRPIPRGARDERPRERWHDGLAAEVDRHARGGVSVLLTGETGTGRSTLAARAAGDAVTVTVSGGDAPCPEADRALRTAAAPPTVLVVDDADRLGPGEAAYLGRLADEHALRLVVTAGPELSDAVAAELGARCPGRLLLPALRDRQERLPALAGDLVRRRSGGATRLTPPVLRLLCAAAWPGNLRELATLVDYLVGRRSCGDVTVDDLPPGYREAPADPVPGALREAERRAIVRALERCEGNKVHAARLLGISRTTLYRRVRELHLGPVRR